MLRGMVEEQIFILAPLVAIIAIGFVWRRAGLPFDHRSLTALTLMVAVPCLVFSALTKGQIGALVVGNYLLAAATAVGISVGLATLVSRCSSMESTLRPALAFGNVGNIGLPVSNAALGAQGLTYATIVFVLCLVLQTGALALTDPEGGRRRIVRAAPVAMSLGAALIFISSGGTPPRWLLHVCDALGSTAMPMMLLALGHALGRTTSAAVLRVAHWAALRLIIGVTAGGLATWLFGLAGVAAAILILQSATPSSVFASLAPANDASRERVAATIAGSTVLYLALLPVLLWWLASDPRHGAWNSRHAADRPAAAALYRDDLDERTAGMTVRVR